jgi:retinal rod rhodopsin-sensitive cGMP 3',5'-cyclic phosphodiesterase subunit delta
MECGVDVPDWLLRADVTVEGLVDTHVVAADGGTGEGGTGASARYDVLRPTRTAAPAGEGKGDDAPARAGGGKEDEATGEEGDVRLPGSEDSEALWEALQSGPPACRRGTDPRAAELLDGFALQELRMRSVGGPGGGAVLWQAGHLDMAALWSVEMEAHLPATTLACATVARQVVFSSRHLMRHFFMVQRVFVGEHPVEHHEFDFGFVMPGSTNTFERIVDADEEMLPLDQLSGNLVVETQFWDKDVFLASCVVRVFYDRA